MERNCKQQTDESQTGAALKRTSWPLCKRRPLCLKKKCVSECHLWVMKQRDCQIHRWVMTHQICIFSGFLPPCELKTWSSVHAAQTKEHHMPQACLKLDFTTPELMNSCQQGYQKSISIPFNKYKAAEYPCNLGLFFP